MPSNSCSELLTVESSKSTNDFEPFCSAEKAAEQLEMPLASRFCRMMKLSLSKSIETCFFDSISPADKDPEAVSSSNSSVGSVASAEEKPSVYLTEIDQHLV